MTLDEQVRACLGLREDQGADNLVGSGFRFLAATGRSVTEIAGTMTGVSSSLNDTILIEISNKLFEGRKVMDILVRGNGPTTLRGIPSTHDYFNIPGVLQLHLK